MANDAYRWAQPGAQPRIGKARRDWLTEMAYFRVYLAWEVFLEEAFILYLAGRQPSRGRQVVRFSFPPDHKTAKKWVIPEGRPYASWAEDKVVPRAERFFRSGHPFASALRGSLNSLSSARTIRNAIAHDGASAREKFETVVRKQLGILPPNTTVGSFLSMTRPGATPPESFLESYVGQFETLAASIVPA